MNWQPLWSPMSLLVSLIILSGLHSPLGESNSKKAEDTPKLIELRGRVVDLLTELRQSYPVEPPRKPKSVLAFKTINGDLFILLETRTSVALFLDPRLHKKDLVIHGRTFPKSKVFEPTSYRTMKDGRLHDLYYWCDICSIKSLSPEDCACCQEPVILTEVPIMGNSRYKLPPQFSESVQP